LTSLNGISHGEGFATSGDAQKRLLLMTIPQPPHQLFHCLGLVAGKSKVGDDFKE
jgi:hypothetical protein